MFCLKHYSFFLFFVFFSAFSIAKPSLKDYGSLPSISLMTLSPDGSYVAFRKIQDDKDLLVVYSIEEGKPTSIVDVSAVRPRALYFVSDEKLVIRTVERKRIMGYRGDHDISAAFVFDIKTGGLEQLLVPGRKIHLGQTNVGSIVGLSDDGKSVFMPAYVDSARYGLLKVELDSPSWPNVVDRGGRNSLDFFLGPNKEVLVEEIYNERSNTHEIRTRRDGKWQTIYKEEAPVRTIDVVGLTADFSALAIVTFLEGSDRQKLLTMSLADGAISDPGFNRDDADLDSVISDINRIVYGVRYTGLVPSYRFFDDKKNKRVEDILAKFSDNSVYLSGWTESMDKIIALAEGSSFAGDYFLFAEKQAPKFLAATRSNINSSDVHPIAKVTVKGGGGFHIPTLLTIPNNKVAAMKNLPAVMLPHGGPASYDQIGFDWMAQALANEGYLVIQPNFRGSTGFGFEHKQAGYGEWGGKMQDDLSDVLAFLVSKKIVDKNRVCIVGSSYGGYAALAGGAFTPELYRCVVSINGVSDLVDMVSDDKRKYGRESWVVTYFKKSIGGDENTATNVLKEKSPYYYAENFQAPVLLIHGENDDRVDYDHSNRMRKKLKKAKKKVKLVKLDDESHYLESNEMRQLTLREVVSFVNRHLSK